MATEKISDKNREWMGRVSFLLDEFSLSVHIMRDEKEALKEVTQEFVATSEFDRGLQSFLLDSIGRPSEYFDSLSSDQYEAVASMQKKECDA